MNLTDRQELQKLYEYKDGILKHLGLFITKELAYDAYCKAAKQVQGNYAHQTTKL